MSKFHVPTYCDVGVIWTETPGGATQFDTEGSIHTTGLVASPFKSQGGCLKYEHEKYIYHQDFVVQHMFSQISRFGMRMHIESGMNYQNVPSAYLEFVNYCLVLRNL